MRTDAMNNKFVYLAFLLLTFFMNVHADEMTLQEQIDSIKEQIRQEEAVRDQLQDDITAMDSKVENLRQRLQELETKISSSQE